MSLRIVIPFHSRDGWLSEKSLVLAQILDGKVNHPCLLAYDSKTDPSAVAHAAGKYFSEVQHFQYKAPRAESWPQAPNNAWQKVARHIYDQKLNTPWFWLEPDAVPIRKGWIDILEAEYLKGGKAFMGHIVEGMGHMNGVGVYPWDIQNYSPSALVAFHKPWDTTMRRETIRQTHNANHLIGHCWNIGKDGKPINGEGNPASFKTWKDVEKYVDFNHVIFHRCKDGTLAERLIEKAVGHKEAGNIFQRFASLIRQNA